MRIVLLGPPGVGKGTQAKLVAAKHKLEKISTGDLLRAELANRTELGKLAEQYMRQGMLVPDDIVNKMVAEKIASLGRGAGFLLDGYPRTSAQAVALEAALQTLGANIDKVIAFQSDENTLLERILGRAFFLNDTATTEIYTLSLHDALPIYPLSNAYVNAFNFDVRNREVQAFATIYATGIGQRAYEYTEKKQGYFSWAVV